jgi:hypothetical protein
MKPGSKPAHRTEKRLQRQQRLVSPGFESETNVIETFERSRSERRKSLRHLHSCHCKNHVEIISKNSGKTLGCGKGSAFSCYVPVQTPYVVPRMGACLTSHAHAIGLHRVATSSRGALLYRPQTSELFFLCCLARRSGLMIFQHFSWASSGLPPWWIGFAAQGRDTAVRSLLRELLLPVVATLLAGYFPCGHLLQTLPPDWTTGRTSCRCLLTYFRPFQPFWTPQPILGTICCLAQSKTRQAPFPHMGSDDG